LFKNLKKEIMYKTGLIIALSIICSNYSFGQGDRTFPIKGAPRNIIIVNVNGMGMNQIGAAALKKGDMLSLTNFPVTGFIQAWPPNGQQPSDSVTAEAIGTNKFQNSATNIEVKTIFDLAKEEKMKTALIETGPVTETAAKTFVFGNTNKKDNEALALDYIGSNIDIIIGGGSKYFDKRYDGRNLLKEFRAKGYNVVSKLSGLNKPYPGKTAALVEKDGISLTNKDFLTKAASFAIQSMGESAGYLLIIDDSKVEEADSLNSIALLTLEMLDLNKLATALTQETGNETLIIITGNYESGGLELINGDIKPKQEPEVSWLGIKPTAALAPVFVKGPGAGQFSGFYSQADIYKKLASFITSRQ